MFVRRQCCAYAPAVNDQTAQASKIRLMTTKRGDSERMVESSLGLHRSRLVTALCALTGYSEKPQRIRSSRGGVFRNGEGRGGLEAAAGAEASPATPAATAAATAATPSASAGASRDFESAPGAR